MTRASILFALTAFALFTAAQRPINYISPTVGYEVDHSEYGILGIVTALEDDPNPAAGQKNATIATINVLCSFTGAQAISGPTITVQGFGEYNPYCASFTTVGFTGLFFLNATLLHAAGTNSNVTNTTATEYYLGDKCTYPFNSTNYNIQAIKNVTGAHAQGPQCPVSSSTSTVVTATITPIASGSVSDAAVSSTPSGTTTTGAADRLSIGGSAFWSVVAAGAAVVAALI
ncbi:hypothetical protein BC937DRAFT_88411 [Endogone sp. FLAS-F59071]|nr:hypothetical protein BC937DRAFT_88411 [Endogone sp. FLAS-F59071]|eukprot:RUS18727.1 hypothetical protein BC937DRAFT_88411 [Endogone sp. FLAS-F59071]